jgi:hypothetical protein
VDNGIEVFNLLMMGNKSLLTEHNDFQYRCEDLKVEMAEARSDAKKRIVDLEVRDKSTEARSIDIATAGET